MFLLLNTWINNNEAYEIEMRLIEKYGRRFSNDDSGKLFNVSNFKGGSNVGTKKPWTEERKIEHRNRSRKNRIYDPSYDELYKQLIFIVNAIAYIVSCCTIYRLYLSYLHLKSSQNKLSIAVHIPDASTFSIDTHQTDNTNSISSKSLYHSKKSIRI